MSTADQPGPSSENGFNQSGSTVHRDQINVAGDAHFYSSPNAAVTPELAEGLKAYCRWVVARCSKADLIVPQEGMAFARPGELELEGIFEPLETTRIIRETIERDGKNPGKPPSERRLTALGLIANSTRLVLLGLPGSGKSSVLRHLSLHLAAQRIPEEYPNLGPLPDWPATHARRLPVLISLKKFAASGTAGLIEYFRTAIVADGGEWKPGRALPAIEEALKDGRAIVLLDGLDEIPEDAQKSIIQSAVTELAAGPFQKSPIVLTCRTYSYRNQAWNIPGFEDAELAEFDEPRIKRCIDRLYRHFPDSDRQAKSNQLWEVIEGKPELRELAGNPLQLTNMAVLHCFAALPDNRSLLYRDLVRLLLYQLEEHRYQQDRRNPAVEEPPLLRLLGDEGILPTQLVDGLARLAWLAHQPARNTDRAKAAAIPDSELRAALEVTHTPALDPESPSRSRPDPELGNRRVKAAVWAVQVADAIRHRGGLLREEGRGIFRFPHRSYQEFMAGWHLAKQPRFVERAMALLMDDAPYWREVVRWASGIQTYVRDDLERSLSLANKLCLACDGQEPDAAGWQRILIAGLLLDDIGQKQAERDDSGRTDILPRARRWLERMLETSTAPVSDRAHAGRLLGRLGDPRRGIVPVTLADLAEIEFCWVVPGRFYYGTEQNDRRNETLTGAGFWIARFPVTVAQYRLFVVDDGYKNAAWWGKAIEAGAWENGKVKAWDGGDGNVDWREEPGDCGFHFGFPNQPVVGICWYEAAAFADWLSSQLRPQLPKGWKIALPSEYEWEHGARGGETLARQCSKPIVRAPKIFLDEPVAAEQVKNVNPKRTYPWGEEWNPELANWGKAEIGATSAAGCFCKGASPVGAEEMAGNVWEWTDSWYDSRENTRVLRGGSWLYNPERLRVAYRSYDHPVRRNRIIGFRCVLVRDSLPRTGL